MVLAYMDAEQGDVSVLAKSNTLSSSICKFYVFSIGL
jgi:hypothetical protein